MKLINPTGVYPMTRKSLILLFAIAVLVVGGVFVAVAQDDDNPVPFGPGWMHNWGDGGFGPGMMHGHGMMMGGGFGPGMMWSDGEPMMDTVAEALGLEPEDFFTALRDGQTLVEIADAQGVELETVYEAMTTEADEHLSALVEAGTITQEQADAHLAWMRGNISEMPMFSGGGFGPHMGGQQGGFGPGMMGHGGHHWQNNS
jgi:hypothetical protein